jgi:hypothetical protein
MLMNHFRRWAIGAGVIAAAAGSAIGQEAARGREKPTARLGPATVGTTGSRPGAVPTPAEQPPVASSLLSPAGTTQAMTLYGLKVAVEGRAVEVRSRAEVVNTDPGDIYVWLLRAYDPKIPVPDPDPASPGILQRRRIIKEHHYLEEMFTLPADRVRARPTFHDFLELPPGRYFVEVTLYQVPADFPFKKLTWADDIHRKAWQSLSRSATVVIAPPAGAGR